MTHQTPDTAPIAPATPKRPSRRALKFAAGAAGLLVALGCTSNDGTPTPDATGTPSPSATANMGAKTPASRLVNKEMVMLAAAALDLEQKEGSSTSGWEKTKIRGNTAIQLLFVRTSRTVFTTNGQTRFSFEAVIGKDSKGKVDPSLVNEVTIMAEEVKPPLTTRPPLTAGRSEVASYLDLPEGGSGVCLTTLAPDGNTENQRCYNAPLTPPLDAADQLTAQQTEGLTRDALKELELQATS